MVWVEGVVKEEEVNHIYVNENWNKFHFITQEYIWEYDRDPAYSRWWRLWHTTYDENETKMESMVSCVLKQFK